jgi:glycosyltransferase involved in cell wall biosynthesis
VQITGHLDDVTPLYDRARVFIAPTRYAAGIPHKVHEASAHGIPVVATPVLARQLQWSDDKEIRVAETADAFAEKCVELHQDKESWMRIRNAALAAIRFECTREAFEKKLQEILASQLQTTHAN